MKKSSPLMYSKILPLFALALASTCASSSALVLISPTVNDGSFESITSKQFFNVPTSDTSPIPYWGATLFSTATATTPPTPVGAPNDSGAENNNGSNTVHSGIAGAFFQPGANAFNLATNYTLQAGDVVTLTWYAYKTGAGAQQTVTLFTQASADTNLSGSGYLYTPSSTVATADGAVNPLYSLSATAYPATPFILTYTATAEDAGKFIGLTIGNQATDYMAADDFTLQVEAVPEPSTLALAIVGLFIVPFYLRRFRRTLI